MMKNYNQSIEINRNLNWSYISEHPYRIVNINASGEEKIMLKHQQTNVKKNYLFVKDPFESQNQLLINGR